MPQRVTRTINVLRAQGVRPFFDKTSRAIRTELERRLPSMRRGPEYSCPCCGCRQPFLSYRGRPYAQCPECGAKERDRLLILVLEDVIERVGRPNHVLHVAPENQIRRFLSPVADNYIATDLTHGLSSYAGRLSAASDLTCLPFRSGSFDLVVASHVLEHIPNDRAAVREIHRVLQPAGVALLPVPITHDGPTVEYQDPNPLEEMHVRAPGLDYFHRFEDVGFDVIIKASSDYPSEHQLLSFHESGEATPKGPAPIGDPSDATGHDQYIPACFKSGGMR